MGAGISVAAVAGGGNAYSDPNKGGAPPGPVRAPPPPPPAASPMLEVTSMPDCPRDLPIRYPAEARRLGEEASVKVRALIGDDGRVKEARTLGKQRHGFGKAALAAVRKMRCKPGRAGKAAVAVPITYTVDFFIEDW